MQAFKFWSGEWQKAITGITGYNKAVVSLEPSPMLLGVGYIIGPRIASVMVGGGILTALLLVPMIAYFGDGLPARLAAGPAADRRDERRRDLGPVRPLHRRRRGGGRRHPEHAQCPAADRRLGGRQPARPALGQAGRGSGGVARTERDLPMPLVLVGSLGLVLAIAASHLIPTDLAGPARSAAS